MNTKGTIEIRIMDNGFVLTDSRSGTELVIKERLELFKELNAIIDEDNKELVFGGEDWEDWLKKEVNKEK